jgi:hypothetical protein
LSELPKYTVPLLKNAPPGIVIYELAFINGLAAEKKMLPAGLDAP